MKGFSTPEEDPGDGSTEEPTDAAPEMPEVEAATGETVALPEAVQMNGVTAARADESASKTAGTVDALLDRVEKLEDRADRQEAVIHDLLEAVELLASEYDQVVVWEAVAQEFREGEP